MTRKKISPNAQSKNARRPARKAVSLPLRYRLLILVCGMFLLAGFFFAARQHFSSIDISIKNSRLRKMGEELEADKRRLLLSKEIALSPSEIKKAAQKIGFTTMTASNIEVFRPAAEKPKPHAEKSDAAKPKQPSEGKTPAAAEKVSAKKAKPEKAPDAKIKKDAVQPTK